jgi:hypothetical protein
MVTSHQKPDERNPPQVERRDVHSDHLLPKRLAFRMRAIMTHADSDNSMMAKSPVWNEPPQYGRVSNKSATVRPRVDS